MEEPPAEFSILQGSEKNLLELYSQRSVINRWDSSENPLAWPGLAWPSQRLFISLTPRLVAVVPS